MGHPIRYPEGFDEDDDYQWFETEAKGWLTIHVAHADGEVTVTAYDAARLSQDIAADIERLGYFTDLVLVVPAVTRANIEGAVARLYGG